MLPMEAVFGIVYDHSFYGSHYLCMQIPPLLSTPCCLHLVPGPTVPQTVLSTTHTTQVTIHMNIYIQFLLGFWLIYLRLYFYFIISGNSELSGY